MLASPMITMATAHTFPGVLLGKGHDRHGHEEQQSDREGNQTARPIEEPTVDAAVAQEPDEGQYEEEACAISS